MNESIDNDDMISLCSTIDESVNPIVDATEWTFILRKIDNFLHQTQWAPNPIAALLDTFKIMKWVNIAQQYGIIIYWLNIAYIMQIHTKPRNDLHNCYQIMKQLKQFKGDIDCKTLFIQDEKLNWAQEWGLFTRFDNFNGNFGLITFGPRYAEFYSLINHHFTLPKTIISDPYNALIISKYSIDKYGF